MMNTTELIIRSLIDIGQTIEFSPSDGKMVVSISGDSVTFVACDFQQLNELFLNHYIQLGIEAGQRIDGGCTNSWHDDQSPNLPQCPTCEKCSNQWHFIASIRMEERRCPTCKEERKCTNIWHQGEARFGDCPTCGEKIECENGWHYQDTTNIQRLDGCPGCGGKRKK